MEACLLDFDQGMVARYLKKPRTSKVLRVQNCVNCVYSFIKRYFFGFKSVNFKSNVRFQTTKFYFFIPL